MRKVSGRRLAITSETRARLPMNGSRSFRVSPRPSMQCSMAAIGSGQRDRIVLPLERFDEDAEELQAVALGRIGLGLPQLLDRAQCSLVVAFGLDRFDVHGTGA